jgi:hypothetical protein
VGAGPQGLTAAVYLVHAGLDPSDLVVFDPAGDWLVQWKQSFASLKIEHLRSASVHHPHPWPYALLEFAGTHQRTNELFHTYALPSTALFADFCAHTIVEAGLVESVRADVVSFVSADGEIRTKSGARVRADHVVWATNPAVPAVDAIGAARATSWGGAFVREWTGHSNTLGGQVTTAVIGGGLTAAHLVERALEEGHHVEWLTRRPIEVRDFDTDPGWLGPKEMNSFTADRDLRSRLDRVLAARGGGTVPPWMMRRISVAEGAGRVCRRVGEITIGVEPNVPSAAPAIKVTIDGVAVVADRVVLATGDRPEVGASPPLDRLCRSLAAERVGGRPVLDTELRVPGSVVHVMGRLAQLTLGPTAGNLAGARRGAERVVGSVVGVDAMYALADL